MSISDYSTTPASNTSISGINIAEGCSPGGLNDAIRQLMADIAAGAQVGLVPSGIISMWSGSIATIPTGWAICDGTSGTPDLRGRFLVGAGGTYAVGATGGADTVALTEAQLPVHSHAAGALGTGGAGGHSHGTGVGGGFIIGNAGANNGFDGGGAYFPTTSVANTAAVGDHTHTITGNTATAGTGGSHENRPPYYALAYIMKL